ncbi:MAG: hypothetical protein WCY66_09215, partial [Candidatus Cloacimonadales bacterium]
MLKKVNYSFLTLILAITFLFSSLNADEYKPSLLRSGVTQSRDRVSYVDSGFEAMFPPMGWTIDPTEGEGTWVKHNGSGNRGPGGFVFAGNYAAMFSNAYSYQTQGSIYTPTFDLSNAVSPAISFYWWNGDPSPNPSKIVLYTTTDGENYVEFDMIEANLCPYDGWVEYVNVLPNNVVKVKITGISDQGIADTYIDNFAIAELESSPTAQINFQRADFGSHQINGTYDVFSNIFALKNINGGTLTVNSITDLSQSSFSTDFDTTTSLQALEDYFFGFTYSPTTAGIDSVRFEIVTNGGTVAIDLIGHAYQMPENMVEVGYDRQIGKYLPTDPGTKFSYTQSIILQEEINRSNKQIDKLYYYANGYSSYNLELSIYLGHT